VIIWREALVKKILRARVTVRLRHAGPRRGFLVVAFLKRVTGLAVLGVVVASLSRLGQPFLRLHIILHDALALAQREKQVVHPLT
jgi:hypothetical protein